MAIKSLPFRSCRRHFSLLNGSVDVSSSTFRDAQSRMAPLLTQFDAILGAFAEGGGAGARAQHTVRNRKLLARERLSRLMDGGQFTELFRFAGFEQPYGSIPAAGSINALGKVSGRLCFAIANDATVKGGTIFPVSVQKQLRQQELNLLLRLPLIYLIDSGGAFLPLQSDIFPDKDHGGRTFYSEAVMEALGIPQLSMVCGSCTAGGAYVPTMCEETTMVDRIGHIFLGGPPLVQAALGEIVTAEELGGATLHSSVSGCSDHFAKDEDEGFEQLRAMMATLPDQNFFSANSTAPLEPLHSSEHLNGLAPNLRSDGCRELSVQILARLLDASCFFEFKANFGENLVAGFGRLGGRLVGILSSCGPLTADEGLKGSHFTQLCQQRCCPLILLCHSVAESSEFESAERSAVDLRAKANFMASLATFPLPKISVVIGDALGWDSVMLGSRALAPTFLVSWPNARFGSCDDTMSAFAAAGAIKVDDVIRPSDTRQWLHTALTAVNVQSRVDRSLQAAPKSVLRF